MAFRVHKTTSRGGVMRSQAFKDGQIVQCTAGPNHIEAFVSPESDWMDIVVCQGVSAAKPKRKPRRIYMAVTGEYADLLAEFFCSISETLAVMKKTRPEVQIGDAYEECGRAERRLRETQAELKAAEAKIAGLQAELKSVRAHKRKPKAAQP